MKNFRSSLFLFSRDLRIDDNTALLQACEESEKVIPCFIFEKKVISQKNPIYSEFRAKFLIDSINDLIYQFKKKNSKLQGEPSMNLFLKHQTKKGTLKLFPSQNQKPKTIENFV